MSGRIIVLTGDTKYGAGEHFLEELATAFEERGRPVTRLDVRPAEAVSRLQRALADGPDFVLGYNLSSAELTVRDQPFYDVWDTPFVGWLVDNPVHHTGRLRACGSRYAIGTVDATYPALAERLRGAPIPSFFLPHFAPTGAAAELPFADRDFDVVLLGSLTRTAAAIRSEWGGRPARERTLLERLAEEALSAPAFRIEPLLDAGCTVTDARSLDAYVRAARREACLGALADAGIVVDVFGDVAPDHPARCRHRVELPVDYAGALCVMSRAKLVLNPVGSVPAGSHERVFAALASGAVPVSDRTDYWNETFQDGGDLVLFDWRYVGTMVERTRELLGSERRWTAIAERGPTAVAARHLARHRAAELEARLVGLD